MSITKAAELEGMQKVSNAVAYTLRAMREHAQPGMTTKTLDDFGASLLAGFGARSAPALAYGFPGCTCISVNKTFCHGIPSHNVVLQEGDLINIDVSAELNGFWSDNGGSFVLGKDIHQHRPLVDASFEILTQALQQIKNGVRIADVGGRIEASAKQKGFRVIKNLNGHGVGRHLHEMPHEIANYRNKFNRSRFHAQSVVAVETFISTTSNRADTLKDGWTMVGNRGGYMAQHEHTIVITDGEPMILTIENGIG